MSSIEEGLHTVAHAGSCSLTAVEAAPGHARAGNIRHTYLAHGARVVVHVF